MSEPTKDADLGVLGKYIRSCADRMGLRDWTLVLKAEPLDESEGAWAKVEPTDGQKHAVVHVSQDFRTTDADTQRMAIIHELTHCHMASIQFFARVDLGDILGSAGMLMQKGLERDIEYAVDGIAVAWAETFPMVKWPA